MNSHRGRDWTTPSSRLFTTPFNRRLCRSQQPESSFMAAAAKRSTFHLVLIKPTHYDDDGYPITWLR